MGPVIVLGAGSGSGTNRVRLSHLDLAAPASVLARAESVLGPLAPQNSLWKGEVICAVATKDTTARRSWRTGSGPGGMSLCSVSSHCRRIVGVSQDYLPVVVGVAVVADHVLRLLFSDATAGDVDFSAERWTGVLEPLNDPAYFAQVRVDPEAGTIAWPDGIDLAPEPLYEQAKAHPLVAA
jgi:hypothetical protein